MRPSASRAVPLAGTASRKPTIATRSRFRQGLPRSPSRDRVDAPEGDSRRLLAAAVRRRAGVPGLSRRQTHHPVFSTSRWSGPRPSSAGVPLD